MIRGQYNCQMDTRFGCKAIQKGETYAPFRLNIKDTKATWMSSLPHSWENQVDARNNGKYDGWLEAKKSGNKEYEELPLTLGYYNRQRYSILLCIGGCFHRLRP